MTGDMDTLDSALRVCQSVAFCLHCVIGLTEPFHHMMNTLTEDSLPYPSIFFPVAGLCLATVAAANFSDDDFVVLAAQAYIVAFHTGGAYTHIRINHHPATAVAPGFFVVLAFIVIALRTNVLIALVVTACFVGVGMVLGRLMVRPNKGWKAALLKDSRGSLA